MKRAVVAIVLVIVGLGCLVDRKSEDFECDGDTDCEKFADGRTCTDGHCVTLSCPSACASCGASKTCMIVCTNPNDCKNGKACPAGYTCAYECNQDCKPTNCTADLPCTVNCAFMNATCTCNASTNCSCSGVGICQ